MKDKIGVYFIINRCNLKIYVGSSINVDKRVYRHKNLLRRGVHGNKYLQEDFNFYGETVFNFAIIERYRSIDMYKLRSIEDMYIQRFKSFDRELGYNIEENAFKKISVETKLKISKTVKSLWDNGYYKDIDFSRETSWNKGLLCPQISKRRREIFSSIAIYKNENLIGIFRSATDIQEYSENNIIPGLEFYNDSANRPNLGKRTSKILASNIHRAIRNKKPLRGLTFKKCKPLPPEMGVVKWMKSGKAEMPILSQANSTLLEGAETNGEVQPS